MKNSNLCKVMGLIIFTIAFLSCSTEDGEDGAIGPVGPQGEQGLIGPQGEQGEQGPAGVDGQNGQDGTDGEDGTANIIFSEWMRADWNDVDTAQLKTMHVPVTEISSNELRSRTLVYMYLRQFGTNSIYTMPGTGRWSNTWYSFTFGSTTPGFEGIVIRLESTNGVDLTEFQYSAFRGNMFRYILIPESAQAGKSNYSDYEAVKAFYNLPD
ncbi:hypothetical protein [Ulvibacterium marinum]|uniref:hypothetical protein n=1 Tax=Ulvibacterium marinum TaxID=2419782 RepID=UPI00249468CB|nr:hypothetical protein [Ulvibacterium marinum]